MRPLRVLIIGGGIGGLALGAFLKKEGWSPVIIEKESSYNAFGLLGIFPNGYNVLADMGVGEEIRSKALELTSFTINNEQGTAIWKTNFQEVLGDIGPMLEMDRASLHEALLRANVGTDMRMNTTAEEMHDRGNMVFARFSDGRTDEFDLVIGADGVNSPVRTQIFPEVKKNYSGFTFWASWIDWPGEKPDGPVYFLGDRRMVAVFPTRDAHRMGSLFLLPAPKRAFSREQSREHLREHFAAMNPEVEKILAALPVSAEIYHNDDDEILLYSWHKGRIALLGDAAHTISPVIGMGASMAMEDAMVLTQELRRADTVEQALCRYEKRRVARVRFLLRLSSAFHQTLGVNSALYHPRNMFIANVFSPGSQLLVKQFLQKAP